MSAPGGDPVLTRKLLIAAVLEGVLLMAGVVAFRMTDQVFWIIGAAVLGSLFMGVWLMLATRNRPSASSSIVEGGDRR